MHNPSRMRHLNTPRNTLFLFIILPVSILQSIFCLRHFSFFLFIWTLLYVRNIVYSYIVYMLHIYIHIYIYMYNMYTYVTIVHVSCLMPQHLISLYMCSQRSTVENKMKQQNNGQNGTTQKYKIVWLIITHEIEKNIYSFSIGRWLAYAFGPMNWRKMAIKKKWIITKSKMNHILQSQKDRFLSNTFKWVIKCSVCEFVLLPI